MSSSVVEYDGNHAPAVLLALRSMQEKVKRLETDRNEAIARASKLRSELALRESDNQSSREDFAREEVEKLEMGRLEYERVLKEKHAAEVELARSEEKRKGVLREIEVERNRCEDYRCDIAAAEGKISLLVQRNAAMRSEIESSQQTVQRLSTAFESERTVNSSRSQKLRLDISELLLSIDAESRTRVELDKKIAKSEEFLSSIMSINEALVSGSHARRDAGLIQRGRSRDDSRTYYTHSPARKNSEAESAGSSSTKKKKTTKKKTAKKKSAESDDSALLRRRKFGGPSPSPSPRSLPPPPPKQQVPRSRPSNHPSKTVMRSTRASRAAAASTKEKFLDSDENRLTMKDRIRIANFGPVPFLPAPRLHSFNVLAAVSEAVRTENCEIEYRVHHHRGSVSLSPPRGGAFLRENRKLEVNLPGVILGPGMSTSPAKSVRKVRSTSPPKERRSTPKKHDRQQQQLPLELAALLSSLEDEFEEISTNYNALLSQSKPDREGDGGEGIFGAGALGGGGAGVVSGADGTHLLSLAEKMQRKENQMLLFKNAVRQAADNAPSSNDTGSSANKKTTLPPPPPARKNPIQAISNL